MIAKGSIKLRIMSDLTEKNGDTPASLYWKEAMYRQHENAMISVLRTACGLEDSGAN